MTLFQWLKKHIFAQEDPQDRVWQAYILYLEKNIGKPGTKMSLQEFKNKVLEDK